jgi:hypothetical protein
VVLSAAVAMTGCARASWTVVSPGGAVRATVTLADAGGAGPYAAGQRLYYRVEAGGPSAYVEVVPLSPLGITRGDDAFVDGLSVDGDRGETAVDETYTMLVGKRSRCRDHARERTLAFRSAGGHPLELVARAYDDGFAFRYRFPDSDARPYTVTGEATGFRVPAGSRAWMMPYNAAGMYTPAYEDIWQFVPSGTDVSAAAHGAPVNGWAFPALFQTPSRFWVLVTETDLDGRYFGAHLDGAAPAGVYRVALPAADEGNGIGAPAPTSTLPWQTPWRVVIVGPSPGTILESTLPTDLATPPTIAETAWIKPGRASWSWWSDDPSATDYAHLTPFVDLAAEMGWEYSLVDAGWAEMRNGSWRDIVGYASGKNVGIFLWYNSGGPGNSVKQYGPRDRLNDPAARRAELQAISDGGVKGIKVDFLQSDKPPTIQYYLDILHDAAAAHLMVNFHGATLPRGWQRTYPNLMAMEAVRGAEMYKFDEDYPARQPERNTILPFTRNAMGSMDFTPVTLSDAKFPHVTTNAHELALSVVFESGVQHFADTVAAYRGLDPAARSILQTVPTAWDDTHFVDGFPGDWLVLARRKGTTWYVAGIVGDGKPRTITVPLTFLEGAGYTMTLVSDGDSDRTLSARSASVSARDTLTVAVRAQGGFVARLAQELSHADNR